MELQFTQMENGIRLIKLIGQLDIKGVGDVETKFVGYTAGREVPVLVDLSGVTYLSSIGIRLLLWTAKAVIENAGKFVMLNPTPLVADVLDVSGMKNAIPIYSDYDAAVADLLKQKTAQIKDIKE